ncbi:aminopeptidase P family protein [Sphingomonas gilva]|uniref:Aminopeptidase P family protein n=2 Tax=Sphingomonas gilva TaxID=2305907 RepID=A0A396RJR5_9SPHN|nr:aminopeptidase P family protein [Sphingomonas gilva]
MISRRSMIGAGLALPFAAKAFPQEIDTSGLSNITAAVHPIGLAERRARLERAQALMAEHGIGAILVEPGASLVYFTGVRWGRSERLTAAVIPAKGKPVIVTPFFERPSVEESLGIDADIRVWQEHEDPLTVVAGVLRDRDVAAKPVGVEETVRFFAVDGLRKVLPRVEIVSANPVVRGCRMIKSAAEIALMQAATNVTIAAYKWIYPRIREGMTPREIGALMSAATRALGGSPEFNLILLGEAAAYPHGTGKPQAVREGEVVLMDCGCSVHDYESDVSRTFVPGAAPAEVRRVWDLVAEGQQVAFRAARIGRPAGSVDDAVRAFYLKHGFGPDYALPGLSHRTGHGIGMDGHEPVNFVRGETTKLALGMCFSNEPGLYLPGMFGVRLEDCLHMAAAGPQWFSTPPKSLDAPFG